VRVSADRSVMVGAAILGVGAAVVVARLAHVWQGGGPFWDVWSVLGVVLAGLGLMIMLVGWVMPKEESSSGRVQIGGDGSTNLQAGRDITIHRGNREE
jgi:hypothetical protein